MVIGGPLDRFRASFSFFDTFLALPAMPDFRAYYDERYHFGEDVEQPNLARLWRCLRHLEPLRGTEFLDLGCGVGWAVRVARERGGVARAVGLDFSRTALARARTLFPQASWVQGDGVALPFPDASFDRVFSFGAMEHFPDVGRGFAELRRVLRPGGLAVSVVPNFWVRTDQPQERRATEREWRAVAGGAGLEIVGVASDHGPAILKNRRPLRMILRLVLRIVSHIPGLRYQHVLVLRRRA